MNKWLVGVLLATIVTIGAGYPHTATAAAMPGHEGFRHGLSVHRTMYMQLLADRYAPGTSGEWKAVFDERSRLFGELRKLRDSEDGKQKTKAQSKREHSKKHKPWKKEHKQVWREFTAAIESREDARIREVLPKLLSAEKSANQHLAQWLAKQQAGLKDKSGIAS